MIKIYNKNTASVKTPPSFLLSKFFLFFFFFFLNTEVRVSGEGTQPPGTYHDGNVVPVGQRKGPIHAQHIELAAEERLQVLSVDTHDLGDVVQAARRRIFFHKKISTFIQTVCLHNLENKTEKC